MLRAQHNLFDCKKALAFLLLLMCCGGRQLHAQPTDENASDEVVLHIDPRIDILAEKHAQMSNLTASAGGTSSGSSRVSGSIRSAKGYRVLIFSGTERNKANAAKADFMRRFPGTRVYMAYSLPQYRVKVGDFTSRAQAAVLYRELSALYSPCMVVPDIVEINTFRRNETTNPSKSE